MAIFKCKMCGGDLNVVDSITVAECEYCGTRQTVSCSDDEKRINLYNRANRLRINGEFDKAANIYESIVAEFPEEAEAYWGLVICNFGIEYVDDPSTGKKIPTCHRASFDSIKNDENYQLALEYADVAAQKVYRDEAREIDRIREEILAISKNEKPYDIFICYKETDDKGERTIDSVIAQDVYDVLTDKGYKVFFSRISLEDKLGRQYEPYIFAALNSAKIMLSFGTKYEYFHAVWVKNEWSRFLKLMHADKSKVLIPCYKDMDAYDLPEEFKALQAQDLGKVGATQDLIRGIGKIIEPENNKFNNTLNGEFNTIIAPLIKRMFMFLDDGNFISADEYCEKVLDVNPECADAYLGKLMAELGIKTQSQLAECSESFENNENYRKILRFGNEELVKKVKEYCDTVNLKIKNAKIEDMYIYACSIMKSAKVLEDYECAAKKFALISDYKDVAELSAKCNEKIEHLQKEVTYNRAMALLNHSKSIDDILQAEELLLSIPEFKNSASVVESDCQNFKRVYELIECSKDFINYSQGDFASSEKSNEEHRNLNFEKETIIHLQELKDKLLKLAASFEEKLAKMRDVEREIANLKRAIAAENTQRNSIFGMLKKSSPSVDFRHEMEVLTARKTKIRGELGKYNSVDEINKKISEIDAQIKEQENATTKLDIKSEDEIDAVIRELMSEKLRPFVLKTPYENFANVLKMKLKYIDILKLDVGDAVTFGKYNGDDIGWLILKKQGNKLLLLSIECLECVNYHKWFGEIEWEKSTIRSYLNYDFYRSAFSNFERAVIVQNFVSASKNKAFGVEANNSTQDKIFLLSAEEVEKYLTNEDERRSKIAPSLRRSLPFEEEKCRWWLRTTGKIESQAAFVDGDGKINFEGDIVTAQYNMIRPALWIEVF